MATTLAHRATPARLLRLAVRCRPSRFWLAAGGVGAGVLLALVLAAAYRSASETVVAYLGRPGADLWVAPAGTDNFIRSSSLLSTSLVDSIQTVPGVAAADPILRAFVGARTMEAFGQGRRLTLYGIGYRTPDGLGGPPRQTAGRLPARRNEVVLDRAAAYILSVGLGDTLWLGSRARVVVGLTEGTNLLLTQFVFGSLATAAAHSGVEERASFIIVRLAPGSDPRVVADTIMDRYSEVDVFGRAAFLANSRREAGAGYLPLFLVINLIGATAAALLVALLIYGVVEERRAELAVLVAMGADIGALGRAVMVLAGRQVVAGALLGVAAALLISTLLDRFYPIILLQFEPAAVLAIVGLFAAAGIIAAAIPVFRLRSIDPLEAFRP